MLDLHTGTMIWLKRIDAALKDPQHAEDALVQLELVYQLLRQLPTNDIATVATQLDRSILTLKYLGDLAHAKLKLDQIKSKRDKLATGVTHADIESV